MLLSTTGIRRAAAATRSWVGGSGGREPGLTIDADRRPPSGTHLCLGKGSAASALASRFARSEELVDGHRRWRLEEFAQVASAT